MTAADIGIVGAGIAGRLVALRLLELGLRVEIFEALSESTGGSCSHAAAGMLAPFCELFHTPTAVIEAGRRALPFWRAYESRTRIPFSVNGSGTLVIAHRGERCELQEWRRRLPHENLSEKNLQSLEPDLGKTFADGILISEEGFLEPRAVLQSLLADIHALGGVVHFGTPVQSVAQGSLVTPDRTYTFAWTVDCRGFTDNSPGLRGVRGEMLLVHAPEVTLTHAVRLLHPRYPLYVVPRPQHQFAVGATLIESASRAPVTVRSALELLSALYSVSSAFGEASIIESIAHVRPAYGDNLPRVSRDERHIRINGLYRHGFLLGPYVTQIAAEIIYKNAVPKEAMFFHQALDQEVA